MMMMREGRCEVDEPLEGCDGDAEGAWVPLAEYAVGLFVGHVEKDCSLFLFSFAVCVLLWWTAGRVGFAFPHCDL
jgi:hypothetical protein